MTQPSNAYSGYDGLRRYNVESLSPHPLSVTTLLKSIAPVNALSKWVDKKVARAAVEAYQKYQDVEVSVTAGAEARWDSSEAADFGSSVHLLTEQSDRILLGEMTQFSHVADLKKAMAYVKQWEKTRDAFKMEILAIEVTFVNTVLGYAGTADRVVIIPSISQKPLILDVKTGKRIYADVALQCSALANCDKILHDDGTLEDNPWDIDLDVGVAAHVRPRSAKLYPLDLKTAWPIFKPLPQLALWRAEKIEVVGEQAVPDVVAEQRADLRLRIQQLPPDLKVSVRDLINRESFLAGGSTNTWDEVQLNAVEEIFKPFEKEARERFQHVIRHWGEERGDMELRSKVLHVSGRTSALSELTAVEVDRLVKSFEEDNG